MCELRIEHGEAHSYAGFIRQAIDFVCVIIMCRHKTWLFTCLICNVNNGDALKQVGGGSCEFEIESICDAGHGKW